MRAEYRVNPQVALETIAGRHFLIAYGETCGKIPYLREINETGTYYWLLAEEGIGTGEMLEAAAEVYDAPPEILEKGLRNFLKELVEQGYLLEEG